MLLRSSRWQKQSDYFCPMTSSKCLDQMFRLMGRLLHRVLLLKHHRGFEFARESDKQPKWIWSEYGS
jgi:hypothetical protein